MKCQLLHLYPQSGTRCHLPRPYKQRRSLKFWFGGAESIICIKVGEQRAQSNFTVIGLMCKIFNSFGLLLKKIGGSQPPSP